MDALRAKMRVRSAGHAREFAMRCGARRRVACLGLGGRRGAVGLPNRCRATGIGRRARDGAAPTRTKTRAALQEGAGGQRHDGSNKGEKKGKLAAARDLAGRLERSLRRYVVPFVLALVVLVAARLSFGMWRQHAGYAPGTPTVFSSSMARVKAKLMPKPAAKPQYVIYSDFYDLLRKGKVSSVRFDDNTPRIYFKADVASDTNSNTKGGKDSGSAVVLYTKRIKDDTSLIPLLMQRGVRFGTRSSVTGGLSRVVFTCIALWIPLVPLFLFARRTMNQQSGKHKRKPSNRGPGGRANVPAVKFRDIAGLDHAIVELRELVAFLSNAKTLDPSLNARVPRGVLLSGPPGTGKTMLAKAVAGEADVPFFACSASEFVELFVGRGAARVRDLFRQARRSAPAIVFIDEIDAVGGRRGAGLNEERDQTLNQLLTELDGFEAAPGVMLMAATNRPGVLDPALLRPGRISRRVTICLPDEKERRDIARVHLRGTPVSHASTLPSGRGQGSTSSAEHFAEVISKEGSGFSGAEIANVVNEAVLLAARRGLQVVEERDILEGITRTRDGIAAANQSKMSPDTWVNAWNQLWSNNNDDNGGPIMRVQQRMPS